MKCGIVSLYGAPLHAGHCDYLNAAKDDCDFLIAIVNNDHQTVLKGSSLFMDQNHRLEIIKNLKAVDSALICLDKDSSVCRTLAYLVELRGQKIKDNKVCTKLMFYNSGDRNAKNINKEEENICKILNIETKFLDLPKRYSSRDFRK